MKKIYFLFLAVSCWLLAVSNCSAQYVTIPDTAFVTWLKSNGLDSCITGNRLDTLCPAVLNKKTIDCSYFDIINLDGIQYFKNLDTLICDFNYLDSLPALPTSLTYLDCGDNLLTSLPSLPAPLTYLDCSSNQLSALPTLPDSLYRLYCYFNQLTSLPSLPDSMYELYISYNPNLFCLPELKKIANFFFGATNIQCVPDYGQIDTSSPALNTLPLCSVNNLYNCSLVNGVNELRIENGQWTIYPNPTSGSFTISSSMELNNAVVEIDNVLGEKVFSTRLMTQDTRHKTIDVSNLPAGIYFVRVSTASTITTGKVIKQ